MDNTILNKLENSLGVGRVETNFSLAPYTTFKIGGPAEYFFEAVNEDELKKAIQVGLQLKLPITILGGASNLVLSDEGIDGLVIRNKVMYREVVDEDDTYTTLQVSSGYSITRLAKETADEGFSGLEFHIGLPGTVGGAVYMNSKWYINPGKNRREVYVGDPLVKSCIITKSGEEKIVDRDYFEFAYDHSVLQESGDFLIWAQFKLQKMDPTETKNNAQTSLEYRKKTQPIGQSTCGCFFKNVNGESVGKIIDELGLKGFSVGDAVVSDKHANFIVNRGNATQHDVMELVRIIKEKVKRDRGIDLQEEVIILNKN